MEITDPEWLRAAEQLDSAIADKNLAVVDTDDLPTVPDGLVMLEHRKAGVIDVGAPGALDGGVILNATVLDFLLTRQHLIPEAWKRPPGMSFWGTKYKRDNPDDPRQFVRTLSWRGYGWEADVCWIFGGWSFNDSVQET